MSKREIFNKIKQLSFPKEVSPLLELIESNLDRIEFVKDYVGLKDVIFIAEEEASNFMFPVFGCFNLTIHQKDMTQNIVVAHDAMIYDEEQIFSETKKLLKTTNRTLYVKIGFAESKITNEDKFRIYQSLEKKEYSDPYEAMIHIRKFPDWYVAKFPSDIDEEVNYLHLLESAEKHMLEILKVDLLQKIDESLTNNDHQLFSDLSYLYGKVFSEIN